MAQEISQERKISLIAIAISAVALLVAFIAWNNSRNFSQGQFQEFQLEMGQIQQQLRIDQTRQRLEVIRENIAAGTNLEQAQVELANIRENLRNDLQNAQNNQAWTEIDAELEKIEQQLRAGSAEVLTTIDSLLIRLREEIRYDE